MTYVTAATLKSTLLAWMKRETGITVIFARQDMPRPKFPYGTIWAPLGGARVGAFDETRATGLNDEHEQHGMRTTTVSLNIYGDGANDKMSRLRDSLDWPRVQDEFRAAGIAVMGEVGPQDLSAFEDTQTTERSQLDVILNYAILRTPAEERGLDIIEEVHVTGEDLPTEGEDIDLVVGEAEDVGP